MRLLRQLLPLIDSEADWAESLDWLDKQQIYYDVTLAFTNKPLAALPQVQRAQDLILSFLAAPSESAASSLSRMPEPACIRSPVPSLNRLLSGGWPVGQLSSVSSTRGVGKTLLCLTSVLQFLIDHPDATALYIDTEGAFSPERAYASIKVIIDASSAGVTDAPQPRIPDAEVWLVLDRLTVSTAMEVSNVLQALHQFRSKSKDDMTEARAPAKTFIVVDSISQLFKDKLSGPSAQGNASMVSLLRLLRSLAEDSVLPAAVLLVNGAVSALPSNPVSAFPAVKHKPALGKTFLSMIDLSVFLSYAPDVLPPTDAKGAPRDEVVAELFKSRDQLAHHWRLFKSDGIAMFDEPEKRSTAGNQYQVGIRGFSG